MSAQPRPAEDEVVLITGVTAGLGRELARALAADDATVLVHGRDAARGQAAVGELSRETGNDRLAFYGADLASLAAVQALAERLSAERERLTVLVNNAGVGRGAPGAARQLSGDGYELRFAVNYLAPVLLTRLLVPLLVRGAPARVVNVASAAQAAIDFDDPMLATGYDGGRAYAQSKLALVMFTFDLACELEGTDVIVNCLHPATRMPTQMTREACVASKDSLASGLRATLRLALGNVADTGRYYEGPREARAHPQADDPDARRQLRQLTGQLLSAVGSDAPTAGGAAAAAAPVQGDGGGAR
jgi:NAD(P)-dependent dehydrogenase (short-subunit alcohol dehydrogenase family)